MKKMLLLVVLLPIVLGVARAETLEYEKINVETAYTNPYPIEPGKELILGIEVSNSGNKVARNMIVELEPVAPFTLLEVSRKNIKTLPPNEDRVIEYRLFIDSSAASATYEVPVRLVFDNTNMTKKLRLRVQGVPRFSILNMDSDTELLPGIRTFIFTTIKNIGSGKAKRVTVKFNPSSSYIHPVFSGGTRYIDEVKPNEEKRIKFEIMIDSDTEYGIHSGTLEVSYEDEYGNEISDSFDVGIPVAGRPRVQIIKSEVDKVDNELKIEVANIGSAKVRGLRGELIIKDKVFDVDYVTQIKVDKHATLKYRLPPVSVTKATLRLVYEGPDNEKYTQTEMVSWKRSITIPRWLLLSVIGLVGFVLWKKKVLKK